MTVLDQTAFALPSNGCPTPSSHRIAAWPLPAHAPYVLEDNVKGSGVPWLPVLAAGTAIGIRQQRRHAKRHVGRWQPLMATSSATASASAAAAAGMEQATTVPSPVSGPEKTSIPERVPLACPVCQRPVAAVSTGMECSACGIRFPLEASGNFHDLSVGAATPVGELPTKSLSEDQGDTGFLQRLPFVNTTDAIAGAMGLPQSQEVEALAKDILREGGPFANRSRPLGTSTFQSPLVSFAYERGWRQQFASSGFPGPDKEFALAKDFLVSDSGKTGQGVLLDASCGSGLFSRRFAKSGAFREVVALDFSASMLRQVNDFSLKELGSDYDAPCNAGGNGLTLVRGDIGKLPFPSNSLDGVHAGAAIHCWPSPENAIAEIARVLKPGAVCVLSTFTPKSPLRAVGSGGNAPYRFWSKEELKSLTQQCGLVDFEAVERQPAFIMVRARKRGHQQQ